MIAKFESGSLPEQEEWNKYIDRLREEVKESTKEEVKEALIEAVRKRIPEGKFGLFLSGGIDSSLIAVILKKFTNNFVCYGVGTEDSSDLPAARKVAKDLGLEFKQRILSKEEVIEYLKKAEEIMDEPNVVNVGVSSVIIAAAELAEEKVFFGGLGSEEIFAGYQRHEKADDVNEECWKGLKTTWERDLTRDTKLGKALGIKVLVPFMDEELVKKAMGIKGEMKINSGNRKVVLREIAEELGLSKEISWRKKVGAQYGSGFDKVLGKLAKEKRITKSQYVGAHLV